MNLTVDIGNTLQKIALFEDNQLIEFYPLEKISIEDLEQLYLKHISQDITHGKTVK